MTTNYLAETKILNYQHSTIQALIEHKNWQEFSKKQALKAVYYFIRDEIKFGYNCDDTIAASEVLSNGYGQCNTKGSLFMAILRALNVPCRLHGFTIYNALQRGAIPNYLMKIAPKRILHSWVEVEIDGQWFNHEGFIIDELFLTKIQQSFANNGSFSGFGIDVQQLQNPPNEFNGGSTYIQSGGIADDYGVFNSPDDFYSAYGSNLYGFKKFIYRYGLRHLINHNVEKIRKNGVKLNN